MVFKINLGFKGKTWKVELSEESLAGKSVGDTIKGEEIKPELVGYELKITGGSDSAGFPMFEEVDGLGLKRLLLTKGKGMRDNVRGSRIRKTVRGKAISSTISQLNMAIVKEGSTKIEDVFPEQNKPKEAKPVQAVTPVAAT